MQYWADISALEEFEAIQKTHSLCFVMSKRLWVVTNKSLKTKEESSWVIPKMVTVAYESGHFWQVFSIKFKSQFKWGFTNFKVAVTRAGQLGVVARRALTVSPLHAIWQLPGYMYLITIHEFEQWLETLRFAT